MRDGVSGQSAIGKAENCMPPLLSVFLEKQRYQVILPYLHGDILDLGCGYAKIVTRLKLGQRYVGIEHQPAIVHWLLQNRPEYEFHQNDLDRDELVLDRQFDTVLMIAVIEHLDHPDHIFSQIPRCLKPDGRLVITTPSLVGGIVHKIGTRIRLFYREAAQDHKTFFTYDSLRECLQRNHLRVMHHRKFLLGGNQLYVCQSS